MKPADWFVDCFGLDGPATLQGPVDQGYQGQIWRLVCGTVAYAVKETFVSLDPDQVALAYEFQTRAERLGVSVPHQLLTVDGRPALQDGEETLRLFEWIDLRGPDRDLDPVAVGRTLARLHRAGGPIDAAVDPWYDAPVGRDRWVELVAELRLAEAPFAETLEALVDELMSNESIMEPARGTILCHRDLWSDNLRSGADRVPVVIDWDNCGPASAAGELAMVLMEFGTTERRSHELYAAYVAADGPARITDLGDCTMLVAVLHHITELAARQWLAASGPLARQRATDHVLEFTADPLLPTHLRRLLAVCTGSG